MTSSRDDKKAEGNLAAGPLTNPEVGPLTDPEVKPAKPASQANPAARPSAVPATQLEGLIGHIIQQRYTDPPLSEPSLLTQYGYTKPQQPGLALRAKIQEMNAHADRMMEEYNMRQDGELKSFNESRRKLDSIQQIYVNELLRGAKPDVAAFKQKQAAQIQACKKGLEDLETGIQRELKGLQDEGQGDKDKAQQVAEKEKQKTMIDAFVAQQRKLLDELPAAIEPTHQWLEKKLSDYKRNTAWKKYDIELSQNSAPQAQIFVPYRMDRPQFSSADFKLPPLPPEQELKNNSALVTADAGGDQLQRDETNRLSPAVRDSRQILLDEIERIKNEPPHEGWFRPLSKSEGELDYIIRYSINKHGEGTVEALFLGQKELRDVSVSSPMDYGSVKGFFKSAAGKMKQLASAITPAGVYEREGAKFNSMISDVMAFQKYAGIESDTLFLRYGAPPKGRYQIASRVTQILETIKKLEQTTPARALKIDESCWLAVARCESPKKREDIKRRLLALQKRADDERQAIANQVKSEVFDREECERLLKQTESDIQAMEKQTGSSFDKAFEAQTENSGVDVAEGHLFFRVLNEFAQAEAEAKKGGLGNGEDQWSLPPAKRKQLAEDDSKGSTLDNKHSPTTPGADRPIVQDSPYSNPGIAELVGSLDEDQEQDAIAGLREYTEKALKVEKEAIESQFDALKAIQDNIQKIIIEIDKAHHDTDVDSALIDEFRVELDKLEERERRLHHKLLDRCDRWCDRAGDHRYVEDMKRCDEALRKAQTDRDDTQVLVARLTESYNQKQDQKPVDSKAQEEIDKELGPLKNKLKVQEKSFAQASAAMNAHPVSIRQYEIFQGAMERMRDQIRDRQERVDRMQRDKLALPERSHDRSPRPPLGGG